jgi:hypothetical protein
MNFVLTRSSREMHEGFGHFRSSSITFGGVGVNFSTTWKSRMIEKDARGETSAIFATSFGVTSRRSILMMSFCPILELSRLRPMVTAPSNSIPRMASTLSAEPATRWSMTVPSERAETLIDGSLS